MKHLLLVAALFLSACTAAPGTPPVTGTPAGVSAAATGAPAAAAGGSGVTIVFADSAEPNLLNPALSTESPRVARLIFDTLIQADAKTGAPVGSLATSWDHSPDGLTFTFHIRPNVKWSDGQPFTADDPKFTFDLIRDVKNASPYKSNFDQIASIDVTDAATLRVTLKAAACPFLLNAMTMPILPKHALESSKDLSTDPFNTAPTTGTGPFVFKERQKGDRITLVANANYWQGKPSFDQWIFKIVPNDNAAVLQLKTGEVDYTAVQADAMAELQQAGLDIKTYSTLVSDFLAYNLKRPLFQDVRVRQALAHALDRNQIVQTVLFGQGEVSNSPIPSVSWAFDPQVPTYDYDLDTARQLLSDAGWTAGSDGTLRKDGQPFQFTLETNSGNKVREAMMVIAQAQFKKLGIDVQTSALELSAFNQKVKTQHDFDAAIAQRVRTLDPDQTATWSSTAYPNGQNFVGYNNPRVDQLLQQAATVPGCGQSERQQFYKSFQEIFAQDQPATWLYGPKNIFAVNKRIQGFDPSPYAGDEFNIQKWAIALP